MDAQQVIGDLARRLAEAVPPGMKALQADLERNFHAVLQGAFARLELVTREEFDIQGKVLERTRQRLAALEERIAVLEGRGSPPAASSS